MRSLCASPRGDEAGRQALGLVRIRSAQEGERARPPDQAGGTRQRIWEPGRVWRLGEAGIL